MPVHFLIMGVTFHLVLAFFILFAASKADGLVALLGRVLGLWVILLAVLHIVGFFAPGLVGMKGGDMMHGRWMHHWGHEMPAAAPPAPAAAPQSAPPPAAPAPKKS